MMYPVEHTCAQRQTTPTDHIINHSPPSYQESLKQEIRHKQQFGECRNYRDGPPQLPPRDNLYTTRPSCGLSTRDISRKAEAPFTSTRNTDSNSEAGRSEIDSVPPRNMTRKNFETAMPAMSHPYANFQPHLFQQSSSSYESPYQISSRIIITDSGEVQYERNILGNKPQHHGGFHFKQNIPLPPRKSAAATASRKGQSVSPKIFPRSLNRNAGRTQSCRPSAWGPQKTKPRLEKRASELSDSDDTYVFIPDVVKDPTKSPIPSDPLQNCADPLLCPPVGDSHLLMPTMGGVSQSTDNLMGTDSISLSSENYDDVITVSQQVHLKHSDGSLLHVLATQEVVSNSSILVPESDQPPGQPIRSNSPQKPAIKPRRRKPSSESEVKLPNDTSSPAFTVSSGQKSSTIPKSYTSADINSGVSPGQKSLTITKGYPYSSHPTLDFTSVSSTTSPLPVDTAWCPPMGNLSANSPTGKTETRLVHPPLTPPIPRPRRGVNLRFPEHARHTEDDSLVGRKGSVGQRRLSIPSLPQDIPVSEV